MLSRISRKGEKTPTVSKVIPIEGLESRQLEINFLCRPPPLLGREGMGGIWKPAWLAVMAPVVDVGAGVSVFSPPLHG